MASAGARMYGFRTPAVPSLFLDPCNSVPPASEMRVLLEQECGRMSQTNPHTTCSAPPLSHLRHSHHTAPEYSPHRGNPTRFCTAALFVQSLTISWFLFLSFFYIRTKSRCGFTIGDGSVRDSVAFTPEPSPMCQKKAPRNRCGEPKNLITKKLLFNTMKNVNVLEVRRSPGTGMSPVPSCPASPWCLPLYISQ